MDLHVDRLASPPDEAAAFAVATDGAALGHDPSWTAVLRETYALSTVHLVARDEGGALRGLLPLVPFRGLDGRRDLVSLPFLDGAGILARDAAAAEALLDAAAAEVRRQGARAVELRQTTALPLAEAPEAPRVDMVLPLPADEETLWRALPAKTRNQVRKAGREGLRLADAGGGRDLLADFSAVYRRRMRELGSPPHPRRLFDASRRAFGERMRVVVALRDETPVGALLAIRHGDAVTVPWAATVSAENRRCPGHLVYWEALRGAVAGGCRRFHFGRCAPGSGTWRFKRGWGAEERPLPWLRLLPSGRAAPVRPPSDSPLLAALSRGWRYLPPALSDRLGPVIRRRLAS